MDGIAICLSVTSPISGPIDRSVGAYPAPSIAVTSGTGYNGSTYTATPGTWAYGSPTGQWYSNGVAIPGEINLTWASTQPYEGKAITYRETLNGVISISNVIQMWTPDLLTGFSAAYPGTRANVSSGTFTSLNSLGSRPALVAAGGPTVSGGKMTFDGVDDAATSAAVTTYTATLPIQSAVNLPAASGSGANGGFTCTGKKRLRSGLWAMGNDGRSVAGDATDNLNASIVILSADRTTVVAEIKMSDLGIATVDKSLQGVTEITTTNQIAFVLTTGSGGAGNGRVYFLNATTFAYEGEWTNLDTGVAVGDLANLNGIGWDALMQCIICLPVNSSQVRWRALRNGNTQKIITVPGSIFNDHLVFDQDRQVIWMTTGANGSDGHLVGYRASVLQNGSTAPLYDITITGLNAIEGVDIVGTTAYFANDAGYHGGSPALNRSIAVDISSLPAVDVWPIATTAQIAVVMAQPTAASTNGKIVAAIGASLTLNSGGVALGVPNATTNQLRAILNGVTVTWTTSSLTTVRLVYINVDLLADTAELWVDGVSAGAQTFTSPGAPDYVDPAPFCIGADRGTARFFPGDIYFAGGTAGELAAREHMEGYMAWTTGNTSLLPVAHPYKNAAPRVS